MRAEYDLSTLKVKCYGIDPESYKEAADKFRRLARKIPAKSQEEIEHLLNGTPVDPRSADADSAWQVIWNKPLFNSGLKAVQAARWTKELEPFMAGAWKFLGADSRKFCAQEVIYYYGTNDCKQSYSVKGRVAEDIQRESKVPPKCLFYMQNAAAALRQRAEKSSHPMRDVCETRLMDIVPQLEKEFGKGWGKMSVLHTLTDFGVAITPSPEVVKAINHLELWPSDKLTNAGRDAVRFVLSVLKFAKNYLGIDSPEKLRRFDLELKHLFDAESHIKPHSPTHQKNAILIEIASLQPELKKRGVTYAALFGSVLHGDTHSDSDVDILIDTDSETSFSLLDLVGVKLLLENKLKRSVDLVTREGIDPQIKAGVFAQAERVF